MALRADRIARGQCPDCGKEAAPYYYCYACRGLRRIERVLRRGEKVGGFKSETRGGTTYWSAGDSAKLDTIKWGPLPKEGDARLEPRLRGKRIDVEKTLVEVVRNIGRPCTMEEIMTAWGRLRERRSSPLPSDLSRIIVAAGKRKRKAEKRVRSMM